MASIVLTDISGLSTSVALAGDLRLKTIGSAPPPTVSRVTPAGQISPGSVLEVEVANSTVEVLVAILGDGTEAYPIRTEVVWSGSRMGHLYAGTVRTVDAGGTRFQVKRTGGWPEGPVALELTPGIS